MLRLTPASHEALQSREARSAQVLESAQQTVKNFEYTRLSFNTDPHSEIWRCANPKDGNYAHDLVITKYGVAAFGDMDPLVFSVGASYGMKFLAGDDVDYYLHSKLASDCKDEEFDPGRAEWVLATCVRQVLDKHWDPDTAKVRDQKPGERARFECPEGPVLTFWHELQDRLDQGKPLQNAVDNLLQAMADAAEPAWLDLLDKRWQPRQLAENLASLVSEARAVSEAQQLYDVLDDRQGEFDCNFTEMFYDGLTLTRPSFNLLVRLHVLNIGAKRILEQQQREAAAVAQTQLQPERERG